MPLGTHLNYNNLNYMKNLFKSLFVKLTVVLLLLGYTSTALARTSEEPIITIKTSIYENKGPQSQVTLTIGAIDNETYIDVDAGSGPVEYLLTPAIFDPDAQAITGTVISCQSTKEGVIKIYGDASKIDYVSAQGNYITEFECSALTELDILDLSHNQLQSLDVSHMTKLRALYLADNTFSAESPLVVGGNKPGLVILDLSITDYLDPSFNLSDYPNLVTFDAYHCVSLTQVDPSGCPNLMQLSLDVTNVETLDVSNNPYLAILNISQSKITSIDLSHNPELVEFYCNHTGSYNSEYKIESLDLTNNTKLVYVFCAGNRLTSLDISKCTSLVSLYASDNYLTSLDVSQNEQLYILEIDKNCFDFATLPMDPGVWNTYYYQPRNFEVERAYVEGTEFDYSARVLREGTTTEAVVYSVSEESPESPTILDSSYYTYANGKLTIHKATDDSVYLAFANDAFPAAIIRTDKFLVKTEKEYGLPTKTFNFSTGMSNGQEIAFSIGVVGASEENPVEVLVDLGDYKQVPYTVTTSQLPAEPNIRGNKAGYGSIVVYMPEGEQLSAVATKDIPMYSVELPNMAAVRVLKLENAGLYNIDLSELRCLETLNLSGNNLSRLSLEGKNSYYQKNVLSDINLSNNQLSDLTLNAITAINYLDLSNNQLKDIDFDDADFMVSLNISNNLFESVSFTHCSYLKHLDFSHNNVSEVLFPEENNIEYLACNNNAFTLANLPLHGSLLEENYIYAPQADYIISTKGPGLDLRDQYREIDGVGTQYVWKKEDGTVLTEGVDYTCTKGLTKFLNIEMGKVYCEMTHAAYPAFAGENVYKTTMIEAAGAPTNVVATFTTVNDGDFVNLSLAAEKVGTAVYFDWAGDGINLSQYLLGDTYRVFEATTYAGATVNVYTYDKEEKITVFSMSGAQLSSFDGSKLTDAINITVAGAGLSSITLPENSTNLQELALSQNAFTEFDLSKYPSLNMAALDYNKLTSIDLSGNPNLGLFSAAYNEMNDIKFGNNNNLWALYLDQNNFTKIDFTGAPNIRQIGLSQNLFEEIDLSALSKLIYVAINNNYFTFKTLPLHNPAWVTYYYHNQYPIEVATGGSQIDLKDQAYVDGNPTVYTWYLGEPVVDEYGELQGEVLIEDDEYTVEEGVTTFLKSFEDVMCVMTNSKLPEVWIYTYLIDVVGAGVETIETTADVAVTVVNGNIVVKTTEAGLPINVVAMNGAVEANAQTMQGETVISGVAPGIYVITVANKVAKVIVR